MTAEEKQATDVAMAGVTMTERAVQAAQIRMVAEGSPKNLGSGIAAALIVALAVTLQADAARDLWEAWIWFSLLTIGLVRGIVMSRAIRSDASPEELLVFGPRIVRNGVYCGIVWGSSSWLLLPATPTEMEGFVITAMAMVLMGGAGAQAAYRTLVVTFSFALSLSFVSGLLRFGDDIHTLLALGFVLFAFVAIMFAGNQEGALRKQVVFGMDREQLREQAELERARADAASRAKTAFLAATSHDLRQPMHALVQYFEHLKKINRDPRLDETLLRIDRSIDAMQDLLDSILDLSKIMSGGIQPATREFRVGAVLEGIDAQLRPLAAAKGIQFDVRECAEVVCTDDVLLERILRNLTLNAIRYTSRGQVFVRCRRRGQELELQVWDTGIGIAKEELSRIYDPFYQVANDARDRRKGLGLGLAIVRQLCDLLHHDIRVRSVVGKGTVFVVRVPLSNSSVDELPPEPVPIEAQNYVRAAFVLLIDDDKLSRDATEQTLKSFGCRVVSAKSGVDAVAQLQGQEFAPHILVADYRMEGETGLDAIRMVTQNLREAFGEDFSIPAIVVSGDTSPAELIKVTESGYPMLHKPVAVATLWGALNKELERKIAVESATL
ncbi:hybrid sensor histidine kinase/response regulator [Steroidobacter flavus]|uniref:histidine kinase n=1 Tax=Steroidobacter flavus TaxID=1842136 RepID=A0ABV8SWS0_9GAMM